jgi:hypothetical protein
MTPDEWEEHGVRTALRLALAATPVDGERRLRLRRTRVYLAFGLEEQAPMDGRRAKAPGPKKSAKSPRRAAIGSAATGSAATGSAATGSAAPPETLEACAAAALRLCALVRARAAPRAFVGTVGEFLAQARGRGSDEVWARRCFSPAMASAARRGPCPSFLRRLASKRRGREFGNLGDAEAPPAGSPSAVLRIAGVFCAGAVLGAALARAAGGASA